MVESRFLHDEKFSISRANTVRPYGNDPRPDKTY